MADFPVGPQDAAGEIVLGALRQRGTQGRFQGRFQGGPIVGMNARLEGFQARHLGGVPAQDAMDLLREVGFAMAGVVPPEAQVGLALRLDEPVAAFRQGPLDPIPAQQAGQGIGHRFQELLLLGAMGMVVG